MKRTTEIIDLLNCGLSAKQVANETGCSLPNVYSTAKRYGITISPGYRQGSVLTERKDEVERLVADGVAYRTMAKILGVNRNTVRTFCRNNSILLTEEQTKANKEPKNKHTEKEVSDIIANAGTCFEYVSGYINKDAPVILRCKVCGTEKRCRFSSVVRKQAVCQWCKDKEREAERQERERDKAEQQQAEQQQAKERARRRREEIAREKERKKQERIHACPVCGTQTDRPIYCSNICQSKAMNKRKDVKRKGKIKAALVDKDITVQGLFKRDGGRCYLCGMPCVLDDFVQRDGRIICGDWYPSIDHVIPLSKGGEHSWSNVRLAHRICNYRKSDTICDPPGQA